MTHKDGRRKAASYYTLCREWTPVLPLLPPRTKRKANNKERDQGEGGEWEEMVKEDEKEDEEPDDAADVHLPETEGPEAPKKRQYLPTGRELDDGPGGPLRIPPLEQSEE